MRLFFYQPLKFFIGLVLLALISLSIYSPMTVDAATTGDYSLEQSNASLLAGFSDITLASGATNTNIDRTVNGSDVTYAPNADSASIGVDNIATDLGNNLNVIITTTSTGMGTQNGDIRMSASTSISWSTAAALTMTANRQVYLNNGSAINATGAGDITLNANLSGTATGNFRGIQIGNTSSATIQSSTGDITLNGTGGDTGGFGVYLLINGTTVKTGGNIQITANASADAGIRIVNAVLVEATGSGTMTIQGTSSSTGSNGHSGVEIDAVNTTTGGIKSDSGTIQITGSAALGRGIEMDRMGTVTSNSGAITLTGTGGNHNSVDGIYMEDNAQVTSVSGNINLVGTAPSAGDDGIQVAVGADVTSTSGNITINGTTANARDGVQIGGTGIMVSTGGNVQITGASNGANGIIINVSAVVEATGTGNLSLDSQSTILTNSTDPTIRTASGDLTMTTDDLNLGSGVISGSGTLTIQPATASTTIGIGGGTGTLNIDAAELARLTDGFASITIGDATNTDAVDVEDYTFTDPLNFIGNSINVDGALSGGANSLVMTATQNILMNSTASIATVDGDITLNANTAGTTAGSFIGIAITSATIQSTGTGNIALTAQGGADGNRGIEFNGATLNTNSGTLTVTGTSAGGAGSTANDGVNTTGNTQISSTSGNITITGNSNRLEGFEIRSTTINSTDGNITLEGNTSTSTVASEGLDINGAGVVISTDGTGNITLIGRSTSATEGNDGLRLENSAQVTSSAGDITLTGEAGRLEGLEIRNATVSSTSGAIALNGTGARTGALFVGGSVQSSGSGPLTLTTDNLNIDAASTFASSGALVVQPESANLSIGIGGGSGSLNITDPELSTFQDGFSSITIGDATNGTGAITVNSATFLDPVTIAGGTINDNAGTDITAPSVTLNGNVAPGLSPGQLVVNGDVTFGSGYTLTLELNGATTAGTDYDQVQVTGSNRTVTLTEATLTGTLGYVPSNTDELVIIDNTDSGSNVVGTFNGLAEGAEVTIGDYKFTITYAGGTDNNDVVLGNAVPLAVTLALFETDADTDSVLIRWATVSEQDNLGFNLYRATSLPELGGTEGGPTQLNSELIPAQAPGSGQGAAYEWLDSDVSAGSSYFYWLEDVDVNGTTTRHGPISATVNQTTAVTIGELGTSERSELPAVLSLILMLFAGGWLLRRR